MLAQAAAGYPFTNFDDGDHRVDGDDEGDDSPRNLSEHRSRLTGILVDEFLFTSITGYQDWENSVVISADSLKNPMLFAPQTQSNEVLSQEFRITSPSDRPVEYIARPVLLHTGHDQFDSDLTVGAGANQGLSLSGGACVQHPVPPRKVTFVTYSV